MHGSIQLWPKPPLLLKNLLDFGADVYSSGVDGKPALIHAARTDNASFAMLLLEYGADLNATSTSGSTPLTTAITNNSRNVLRLILDRWREYSGCARLKGPHLLRVDAQYADTETLSILAATDHIRLKYDKQYTLADFETLLNERPDQTEELALAFDDLLSIINQVRASSSPASSPACRRALILVWRNLSRASSPGHHHALIPAWRNLTRVVTVTMTIPMEALRMHLTASSLTHTMYM